MKAIIMAAVAAAIVVPVATVAGKPNEIIVDPAPPSQAHWGDTIGRALDRDFLPGKRGVMRQNAPTGFVAVRFTLNRVGIPENVSISHPSGRSQLDVAGTQAVARLRHLRPLPAGVGENQVFEARMISAYNENDLDQRLAEVRRRDAQLAAANPRLDVLVLGPVLAIGAK